MYFQHGSQLPRKIVALLYIFKLFVSKGDLNPMFIMAYMLAVWHAAHGCVSCAKAMQGRQCGQDLRWNLSFYVFVLL